MNEKIICFGEMLWDQYEKISLPGGAPMNVALHLKQLDLDSQMISKTGNDQAGKELLAYLKNRGVNTDMVLLDNHLPTGNVLINDKDKQDVKYEIVSPVAWDNIEWTQTMQDNVDQASAFIFGSLAARGEESNKTLQQLLKTRTLKIFDINLRAPHFEIEAIKKLLSNTDILKVNEEELAILANFHNISGDLKITCKTLAEIYQLLMICVTRGDKGAILYLENRFYEHPGYTVTVIDTVGSGDAFLSGLVYGHLKGTPPESLISFACGLGAFVAGHQGASPTYTIDQVHHIIAGKD